MIVERAIPPGGLPDPDLPDDPAKAFTIKAIRELSSEQLDQLAQGASDKLARIEGQRGVNVRVATAPDPRLTASDDIT